MSSKKPNPSQKDAPATETAASPTKYVDRPAGEGNHGDGAEEPTEGFPRGSDESETKPPTR